MTDGENADGRTGTDLNLSRRSILRAGGLAAGAGLFGIGGGGAAAAAGDGVDPAFANWRVREASKVWDRGYRGRPDRTVAIGDTGVDARHPDLGPWSDARIVAAADGYDLVEVSAGDPETAVADVGPYAGTIGPGSDSAGAAEYEYHDFVAPSDADQVDATLSWTADTQDIDFYLEDAEGNVVASSTNFGGPEHIKTTVEGGADYTFVVQTWASVAADYEITGEFLAGGVEQEPYEGSPLPDADDAGPDTPKLVGWMGSTFPRDGNGHGTHCSSIMAGSGRASAIDAERTTEDEPRTILLTGERLSYEVTVEAGEGVFGSAYGEAIELAVEAPDGRTVAETNYDTDASETGDNAVVAAHAPEGGTYTVYVRPAPVDVTARVRRAATGAFDDPAATAGDRTAGTPTLHAGIAPNAGIVGIEGLSPALSALSSEGRWFAETFNVRSVNFSYGGLPIERTGTTGIYEEIRLIAEGGILTVSSAGNNGPLTGSTGPSGADEAIAVVSAGPQDGIASYSSGGTVVRDEDGDVHRKPDLTAPGGLLTDLVNAAEAGDPEGDGPVRDYTGKAGTSMAAPYVNGIAGLAAEAMEFDAPDGIALPEPAETTYEDVLRLKHALLCTATETAFTAAPYHRAHAPTYDFGGRDPFEGFGRANPDIAVDAVTRELSGTSRETVGLNRPADDRAVAGYVTAGAGTLDAEVEFSHYGGGNGDATNGDPHLDLFVYDAESPDENGEPTVVASAQGLSGDATASASFGREAEESVYFVVAKLVDVPGAANGDDVQAYFDLSVGFEPGVYVDGAREDDGSVFTAGQTNHVELTVNPSESGPIRDVVPEEWTVLTEYSDDVARIESGEGVQYVHFEPEATADADTHVEYFAEAPDDEDLITNSDRHEFGPAAVRIDGRWIAAAGTSDVNYVVGEDTNF